MPASSHTGMNHNTLVGNTLGKYSIVEHSGSGGMAEVYKAYHPGLDCYVAIKVLHPFLASEEDFLTRFQREARVVATFRHPNIVQVYDFDSDVAHNINYMVMEFIDGQSLKSRLEEIANNGDEVSVEEAVRITLAVANALTYAHEHGMVHRDIKPANIMFTQDGQVILTDFGIARMINTVTLTASGAMVGTPAYMAPEQGSRTGDERSDIYSLGVVLYQLVTGALPFEADTPLGIILKHINAPLTPPTDVEPDLPMSVEAVIMRALAKDPENRYQTAREFAADLEKCLAGEAVAPVSPEIVAAPGAFGAALAGGAQGQATDATSSTIPGLSAVSPSEAAALAGRKRFRVTTSIIALALILLCGFALFTTDTPRRMLAAWLWDATPSTPQAVAPATGTPTPNQTATFEANATQFAAWMATYVATTGVTPTPSPNPTATGTPDVTATALAACVFNMETTDDPQVWPSVLVPGQQFIKRWTILNTGTCPWPEGVHLAHLSGEVDVLDKPEISPVAPGESIEVKITLRAPTAYDRYTSMWQLRDSAGRPIGETLEFQCRVGPTPTPRPTATPTATATPEFTPTPSEFLHFSVPLVTDWHDTQDGKWWAEVGLTAWGGDGTYRYYLNYVSPETEFFYGVYEITANVCTSWWGTVIVTSGDEEQRWGGKIAYPDPKKCE